MTLDDRTTRIEKILMFLFQVLPGGWRIMLPREAYELLKELEAEHKRPEDKG